MAASSSLEMSPRGLDTASRPPTRISELASPRDIAPTSTRLAPALLAFWRRQTRQLASFNAPFAEFLHLPPTVLISRGVTWDNFLLSPEVAQVEELLALQMKPAESRSIGLHFVASDGSVRFCNASIALILTGGDEEELLWTIVPDDTVVCDPVAPPVFTDDSLSRRGSFLSSSEEEADSTEVASFTTRELVPAVVRGRNPWDASVTKFSLKEKRRSPPPVPAAAAKRIASLI
eukprot:Mycagemm_TRINITY_DN10308_c2_g1::TRINITY_DN10308_c2_g1_i5::g.1015::m.1015 type:complete len:233 gc:universal TRINITY_DN10308_c2_g1_i5:1074-376(-)